MTASVSRMGEGARLRLTVVVPGEEFDLEVPADQAIQTWFPDLVEVLIGHGMLTEVGPSWGWYRPGGTRLAEASSLHEQGIASGQRLWLGEPPQSRVRLVAEGAMRKRGDEDAAGVRSAPARMLGGAALGLGLALHLAVLSAAPAVAAVVLAGSFLVVQFALFRWLSSSPRFAERTGWADWEVFAATVFLSGALVGVEIGRVSPLPPIVASSLITGLMATTCLLTGVTRRWQAVFWGVASLVVLVCSTVVSTRLITERQGLAAAMAIAVVAAASSHRIALLISEMPGLRHPLRLGVVGRAGPGHTDGGGVARVSDELISQPRRLIEQARLIQGSVAAATLVVVVAGALMNSADAISLSYSLVCLFALASCAWTASYDGRALTIAVALAAAAFLVATAELPTAGRIGALVAIAVLSIVIALDAALGSGQHPALTATLVRLRTLTIIAVLALLAGDLNAWVLAWRAGVRLGGVVF